MKFWGTSFKFWLCPWNTLKKFFLSIYVSTSCFYGSMSQDLHPNCPKMSVIQNVGWVKSHIKAVRYQIVPHYRRSIYFLHLYENPPVRHTYWTCFMISSNPFSHLLWLNFKYWITCQVCRFTCKSATVYVLYNFSIVLADWYFYFWRKEFSTRAFVSVLERIKI